MAIDSWNKISLHTIEIYRYNKEKQIKKDNLIPMHPDSFKFELQEFLSTSGVSQNQLSKEADVPQSQISDWNKGKIKRFGKNAKKVLNVIENYRLSDEAPLPVDLQLVVRDFYGGKQENCELLKRLITSLKPIIAK